MVARAPEPTADPKPLNLWLLGVEISLLGSVDIEGRAFVQIEGAPKRLHLLDGPLAAYVPVGHRRLARATVEDRPGGGSVVHVLEWRSYPIRVGPSAEEAAEDGEVTSKPLTDEELPF